jgi:hypothetical protein
MCSEARLVGDLYVARRGRASVQTVRRAWRATRPYPYASRGGGGGRLAARRSRGGGVRGSVVCSPTSVALLAGCGGNGVVAADLFIVYRSGSVPGANLMLLVNEEGVIHCDGGKCKSGADHWIRPTLGYLIITAWSWS